jgi:hypothetical protein
MPAPTPWPAPVDAVPAAPPEPPAAADTYLGGLPKTLTLPSGNTVTFRDPEDLNADDCFAVIDGIRDQGSEISSSMDVARGAACILIESWSFQAPIPRADRSQLGKMKPRDCWVLLRAVAPAAHLLFQDLNSMVDAGQPGSPTPPASV